MIASATLLNQLAIHSLDFTCVPVAAVSAPGCGRCAPGPGSLWGGRVPLSVGLPPPGWVNIQADYSRQKCFSRHFLDMKGCPLKLSINLKSLYKINNLSLYRLRFYVQDASNSSRTILKLVKIVHLTGGMVKKSVFCTDIFLPY